ncbi:MAG: queuosine precursor transporter [Ignavibacteriae bacterium]|nr:queuosine precursor transporter [Ignavibacteriota bacterium]
MINTLLIALYIACEIIANITASKPIEVFGLSAPGGIFIYALTFTLVDLINDRLGKKEARHVVYAAFAANILLALYAQLIIALPAPAFFANQDAMEAVLGSTARIVAASLTAYLISSVIDIEIFGWWKSRVRGYKWGRVLVSNSVSTLVDSVVFVTLAFAGVLPLLPLIVGQYILKMAITCLSIPLIYATKERV